MSSIRCLFGCLSAPGVKIEGSAHDDPNDQRNTGLRPKVRKLIWDDELNALRENSNNFIVMGIVLLLFGLFLGGGYFLYKNNYGIDTIAIIIFSILFVLNILVLVLNKKFTVKNILELE